MAAVGTAVAMLGSGAVGVAQAAPSPTAPVPLRWTGCGDGFQCATAKVPLDYAKPRGATISLALVKWPAADQQHKIGSLFSNPGGPGGSGVQFIREAGKQLFGGELHRRFDVVGFDPRGVAASTPVRCFATAQDQQRLIRSAPSFPLNAEQNTKITKVAAKLDQQCARRGGEILRHVTTADAARDLDLLRAAVGDEKTTFYGFSYGTYYAAVYANMFPNRVRAVIADGVVDPTVWSGDERSFWYRVSAAGAERTLNDLAATCAAAGKRCAFSAPTGAAVRARLDRVLAKLREHPVRLPGKQPRLLTYQDAVAGLLGGLYAPAGWPKLAQQAAQLEAAVNHHAALPTDILAPAYDNSLDALYSIACTDGEFSHDPGEWPRLLGSADRAAPTFGRLRLYQTLPCAHWPARSPDRYAGPFNRRTANPVLVIGTTSDPATPISGARKLASLLPNSRLVTLDGYGHTSIADPSRCVQAIARAYLLTSQVPAKDTVCQPDHAPFDPGFPPSAVRPHPWLGVSR